MWVITEGEGKELRIPGGVCSGGSELHPLLKGGQEGGGTEQETKQEHLRTRACAVSEVQGGKYFEQESPSVGCRPMQWGQLLLPQEGSAPHVSSTRTLWSW